MIVEVRKQLRRLLHHHMAEDLRGETNDDDAETVGKITLGSCVVKE